MTDEQADDEITKEDEEKFSLNLPSDFVLKIETAILKNATPSFRKVALIVAKVIDEFSEVSDIYVALRIEKLVKEGALESQGNLRRMRFSEVRLPSLPLSAKEIETLITEQKYAYLGNIFESGQGVTKDLAQALIWHNKAAELGQVWSQLAVGRFYESGYSVTQCNQTAYFWYAIAAENSQEKLPFVLLRDEIAAKLSSDQKTAADMRVEAWLSARQNNK